MKSLIYLSFVLLALTAMMHAQSFHTTVGGSQTYGSFGFQTQYKFGETSGWTGVGFNNGFRFGGYMETRVPLTKFRLGAGDQLLSSSLDTDQYGTYGFTVRGASLFHESKTDSLQLFGGFLTQETQQPYLREATVEHTPFGAVLYQRKLTDRLQFHSLNLISRKLTFIESIAWKVSPGWRFAGATGIGSGESYLSGVAEYKQKRADVRMSYTASGRDFHRQEGTYSTEQHGLNARVSVTPLQRLELTFDHEQSRTFADANSVTGTFDSVSAITYVKGFRFNGSATLSTVETLPGRTNSQVVSASRTIRPWWTTFGSIVRMSSPALSQRAYLVTNEFRINSRLSVRQNYSLMNGQNSFSAGAQWRSNVATLTVDHQLYMSPLAAAFGGKSIFQAWTFGIRFRAPRGTNANVNTFVTPDGKMRWGGYLSGLRYDVVHPYQSPAPTFSRYIIRGVVVDSSGKGVWGIAVQIGDELVLSDSNGEFFARVKSAKPQPLIVAKDFSIQTETWKLKTAPGTAQGVLETATSAPIQVVVQMGNRVVAKN
jgi:hypothetical protein